jgi:hypothetical protein
MDLFNELSTKKSASFNNFHHLANALQILAINLIVIILLIKNTKVSETKGEIKDTITGFTITALVCILVVLGITIHLFMEQKRSCMGKCNLQLVFIGSLCSYLIINFVKYLLSVIGIFTGNASFEDSNEFGVNITTLIILVILTFTSFVIALQTSQKVGLSLIKKVLEFIFGPFIYGILMVYLAINMFSV